MDLIKELCKLCDALNRQKIKYALVGGCAVIIHGYFRTTHDIDILIESSQENISQLKKCLFELYGSEEVFEIADGDIIRYAVVRYAPPSEDIVIDLIGHIGDISFEQANNDIESIEIEGVKIPLLGLSTLIETKKGVRPKDKEDLLFLVGKRAYLEKQVDKN
jgi:predicted nucleotidyltransferase